MSAMSVIPKIAGLAFLQNQGLRVPRYRPLALELEQGDLLNNTQLRRAVKELGMHPNGLSVRSASSLEDHTEVSNAGRFRSFNSLANESSIARVARAIVRDHYSKSNQTCHIIIQQTIASLVSGVTFADRTGSLSEWFFGCCNNVVDACVEPYRLISRGNNLAIPPTSSVPSVFSISRSLVENSQRSAPGQSLIVSETEFPEQCRLLLRPQGIREFLVYGYPRSSISPRFLDVIRKWVREIVEKTVSFSDQGIDIEWGIDKHMRGWVFQIRPMTRSISKLTGHRGTPENIESADSILIGVSAGSTKKVQGKVALLEEGQGRCAKSGSIAGNILSLWEGSVLDYEAIKIAVGVICARGGLLSHLAIACRELSKLCVVGVGQLIPSGSIAELDGANGVIKIRTEQLR